MSELDSEAERHVVDVLVVDDNDDNRLLVRTYLANEGYAIREAANGERALEMVRYSLPDIVLLDVQMPGLSGYDVCERLRSLPNGRLVPVIMVTALHEPMDKVAAADAGADDFISKPFSKLELLTRVRSLLRIKSLTDALDGAENTIVTLARALEARDPYTRGHSQRVGLYGARLAAKAGLSTADQQAMHIAGILHDVGKIGVCEDILQKPGKLDEGEWETMKRHPVIGAEICRPLRSVKRQLPAIRHHHERWDACGYPDGLGQHNIPLGARITAVCDAWDAMTSNRVYRAGMPVERAVSILEAGKGTQWDAELVGLFLANYREISLLGSTSTEEDPWESALNEMPEAHA
ncbi:MAG: response regulator [Chloroflexota bacterium]